MTVHVAHDIRAEASPRGVILVAHGSREPGWAAPFERIRDRIAAEGLPVVVAYLERMAPDLNDAAQELARAGCEAAIVVPLFLGQGSHVRDGLPKLVAAAMTRHPSLVLTLAEAIGEAPHVQEAIAEASLAAASIARRDPR
ncbi:MAG TPA: CbiX/SirB N-terminal domain-containing protein [Casimicrobiaceae bacterium]|jgi:sirohydrochlorin cobaltochelatase|nr:CbiX/SirB N-terminal domain-containing protein [Casimicrobiaceae bacterium]